MSEIENEQLDVEGREPNKSLIYMVSSFMLDKGVVAVGEIVLNGVSHDALYKDFCADHPNINVSREEFEIYVIESLKRIGSATVAEVAAIPGSAAGAGVANVVMSSAEVGAFAFTGSILANFLAFAAGFGYSHRRQFVNENGDFDLKKFIKNLVNEYSVHFGPIAIGADLIEGCVIQALSDKGFHSAGSAAVVTAIGSTLAVLFYFYEQQLRMNYSKMVNCTEVGKKINNVANAVMVRCSHIYLGQ